VLDLSQHGRDINEYLRKLEHSLIAALESFGVAAFRRPGFTGVWTAGGKIAAIGIAVRHWITSHGFALNVDCDLGPFDLIDPCGLRDMAVTSMARELGQAVHFDDVQCEVAESLARQFGFELQSSAKTGAVTHARQLRAVDRPVQGSGDRPPGAGACGGLARRRGACSSAAM
jgi:lipoate-protein ligase B